MMKNLYAVRDDLVMDMAAPFVAESDVKALQLLVLEYNAKKKEFNDGKSYLDPDTQLSTSTLYCLGSIDDGNIEHFRVPICKMSDLVQKYENLLLDFSKENN